MKKLRALALGLLAIPLLAHDAMAGTAAPPPPPSIVILVGTYTTCTSTVCNCTSSTITSTFCHEENEEQFGFEVGGEIITVKTGKKSSQCDQVPVLPGRCVSQCYQFEVWKSCGGIWDTYTSKQVGTIYDEFPATCSVVEELGARTALRARLAS